MLPLDSLTDGGYIIGASNSFGIGYTPFPLSGAAGISKTYLLKDLKK
ncbi:MAG: hypothetical protein MJZ34_11935 [Paludibacteraceae bacterium]|nr:hypothetical protein [Paludibacteraceae bacterium]MCQ2210995.1 hypothetical protein [Paludibacteraceae bacterium]